MSTKNNPSKISDCYAKADPDEPMFVLLGRDKHAPQLVEMWAGQRAAEGEDPAKVEEALKCAKAMRHYRYERKGAPSCEYCEASDDISDCLKISTHVVTENGFIRWFWCGGFDPHAYTEVSVQTIEEYFATDEVDNEYCKDEALRVYHETRAMRARANEVVTGEEAEPTQPTVDEIIATKNVPKREVIVLGRDIEGTDIVSVEVNGRSVWVGPHNLAKEVETTEELPDYGGGISGG